MHAGAETTITVLILFFAPITVANLLTDIPKNNPLNIDWYPAPSPEDGPPLSANASRNKALLPYQISGIVGAYLLCVCVVGVGIFFVSRKLRRQLTATWGKDIEMLETQYTTQSVKFPDASPISPGGTRQDISASPRSFNRNFSWPVQEKAAPAPYVFPATSPHEPYSPYSPKTPPSVENPAVDTRIVERDQHMMERDLEDIYAHVMEQEDAKAAGVAVKEMPLPLPLQGPASPARIGSPSAKGSPSKKIEKQRPANIMVPEESRSVGSRASSIISSIISPRSKNGFKKNMRISSPILSPKDTAFVQKGTEEEREPLTPRYYAPPPPTPVPKDQAPYHGRKESQISMDGGPSRSIAEQLSPYGPGSESAFHKHNPSQASIASSLSPRASNLTLPSSPRPAPRLVTPAHPQLPPTPGLSNNPYIGINPPAAQTQTSIASSTRRLPFRQFQESPVSPSQSSFHTVKTTVLERKAEDNGPKTGGLRTGGIPKTPFSGGAVPYSPYQPFTPMMPITPRLVTREERKAREKMERKMGLRSPQMEKELVSGDIWDSGY
jgi:hypothetical protein